MEQDEKRESVGNGGGGEVGYPVFVPYRQEKPVKVICEVCGHANPEDVAMCKMCSNYLK